MLKNIRPGPSNSIATAGVANVKNEKTTAINITGSA